MDSKVVFEGDAPRNNTAQRGHKVPARAQLLHAA
jgi:hypothetical protein